MWVGNPRAHSVALIGWASAHQASPPRSPDGGGLWPRPLRAGGLKPTLWIWVGNPRALWVAFIGWASAHQASSPRSPDGGGLWPRPLRAGGLKPTLWNVGRQSASTFGRSHRVGFSPPSQSSTESRWWWALATAITSRWAEAHPMDMGGQSASTLGRFHRVGFSPPSRFSTESRWWWALATAITSRWAEAHPMECGWAIRKHTGSLL